MNEQEKQIICTAVLRILDADETLLTPAERRDVLNEICMGLCNMTLDEILNKTENQRKLRIKRGGTNDNDEYTGLSGEITMDTDTNTIRVHDGETIGGTAVAKQTEIPTHTQIANIAMPSSRYIDLDIGATEAEYTAPADGYFVMVRRLIPGGHLAIRNTVTGLGTTAHFYSTSGWINGYVFAPVQAGDTVQITYNNTPSILRFVYANGAQ